MRLRARAGARRQLDERLEAAGPAPPGLQPRRVGAKLKASADRFEKDAPVLGEAERARRQRQLTELDRDLQRRQREFRENLNQRRNEELQGLMERSQRIVRQIAEQEKFDLIVQDAVYFSPRVDITDKVLRSLNTPK